MNSSRRNDQDKSDVARTYEGAGASVVGWRQTLRVIKSLVGLRLKRLYYVRFASMIQPLLIFNIFRVVTFYYMTILGGERLQYDLQHYGGDFLAFNIIGMVAHYIINPGLFIPPNIMNELYWGGKTETVMVTPTPFRAIFISTILSYTIRWIFPATVCWLAFGLLFGLAIGPSPDLISTCLLLAFGLIATYGLGLMAASNFYWLNTKIGKSPLQYVIQNLFLYLVTGLSYPVSTLPLWLQMIGLMLPQTYVFDGIRRAILQPENAAPSLLVHTVFPLHPIMVDLILTVLFIPPFLLVGRWALERSIKYAKAKGTLTRWV